MELNQHKFNLLVVIVPWLLDSDFGFIIFGAFYYANLVTIMD